MPKRRALMGLALLLGSVFPAVDDANAQDTGKEPAVVVELFTSQGCSSCPAADRLLSQLAADPGVIALTFPVTYWDYLGWKDTLAKPEYSQRQRDYALARGDGQVYTPQLIIGGTKDCVGSDAGKVTATIAESRSVLEKAAVPLSAHVERDRLVIESGSAPASSKLHKGTVWVAAVLPSTEVPIAGGENAGRSITYTNVVRKLVPAGNWEGAAASYSLPLRDLGARDNEQIVAFLQSEKLGPIIGAARIGG